jgi:hypothetical protein
MSIAKIPIRIKASEDFKLNKISSDNNEDKIQVVQKARNAKKK